MYSFLNIQIRLLSSSTDFYNGFVVHYKCTFNTIKHTCFESWFIISGCCSYSDLLSCYGSLYYISLMVSGFFKQ